MMYQVVVGATAADMRQGPPGLTVNQEGFCLDIASRLIQGRLPFWLARSHRSYGHGVKGHDDLKPWTQPVKTQVGGSCLIELLLQLLIYSFHLINSIYLISFLTLLGSPYILSFHIIISIYFFNSYISSINFYSYYSTLSQ